MAIVPHSIDIVVSDMENSLNFYRAVGLDVPEFDANEMQLQIATPGGATIGLIREADMRKHNPDWQTPVGQRVTFSCRCDSAEELNTVFAKVVSAGYPAYKEPWDAFWGQRYVFLRDPDGNRVDLFAAIVPEGAE